MDKWLVMFLLGAILSLFLPIVPAFFYVTLLLAFALALFLTKQALSITGLLLGCAWILFHSVQYQQSLVINNLSKNKLHNKVHIIQAEVISLVAKKNRDPLSLAGNKAKQSFKNELRFNVKINAIDFLELKQAIIVRLSWQNPTLLIEQGNEVRLSVKLKPAHGFADPSAFNYQIWLRYKNIVATGYVTKSKENSIVNNKKSFRQQQLTRVKALLPKQPLSALVMALALGDRSQITPQQWQILKATGTQHLIAISGLHLGLVASGVFIVVLAVLKLLPLHWLSETKVVAQITQLNAKYLAISMSLFFTLLYASLSGFAIPTIRALFMLSFYWLSRLLGLKLTLRRWLLLVVFMVLITAPMSILSASFWLSFYAVTIIFLLLWRFIEVNRQQHAFIRSIRVLLIIQLGISILLLPVSALFFQQLSVVAFVANIVAVPLMSFTAIPLSLIAVLLSSVNATAATWLFELCLRALQWLWAWLTFLAEPNWALVALSNQQIIFLLVAIAVVAIVMFFQLKRHYYLYLVPILLALILKILLPLNWLGFSKWQVNVLDVGHGLAIVIKKNNHVVVYDTGAKYPSGFNMAEAVILPLLQRWNIKQIDYLIISHNDNDHIGGLAKLQQNIAINVLMANKKNIKSQQYCLKGQAFHWQGLTFTSLWPKDIVAEENNDSCVIRVSDGKHSVLLSGDISTKVEKQLLTLPTNISADVLVVPHHGSKSSSSELFLQAVKPQYAIFSSGYLNRWKMPAAQVLLNYHRNSIKTYITADVGMVQVNIFDDKVKIATYREDLFPYWFAN